MDIVDELRDVADDLAHRAANQIEVMRDALRTMTQLEPCDCGCPKASKPILMKPHHYYAIALEALGVCIDESRDVRQTGTSACSHVKPSNSETDLVCCESVQTPNAELCGGTSATNAPLDGE